MYVHENGNVTFKGPDPGTVIDTSRHFITPRISLLYSDLQLGGNGGIYVTQTEDRVAVTYLSAFEAATSNEVSMQAELFFDGRICLTYLELNVSAGLVGIASGQKTVNRTVTDFSA